MTGESDVVKWRGVRQVDGVRGIWPARGSVRVNATTSVVGPGTSIIYTVPADKILFISSTWLSGYRKVDANDNSFIYVRDDNDDEQYRLLQHSWALIDSQNSTLMLIPAGEALVDWDVCITMGVANGYARGGINGWLEEA